MNKDNKIGIKPTADSLLKNRGIESMVLSRAMPIFKKLADDRVLCFIPPSGSMPGDKAVWAINRAEGAVSTLEFVDPNGRSRGVADVIELQPDQAHLIKTRIDNLLLTVKLTY